VTPPEPAGACAAARLSTATHGSPMCRRIPSRSRWGLSFGLLEAQKGRPRFDHGHLASEASEGLPDLDADRTSTEDRQRSGQLVRDRRLAVGPQIDAL